MDIFNGCIIAAFVFEISCYCVSKYVREFCGMLPKFCSFLFGCAIYTFVFAAVDVPLCTRSISAVKIIPVKKVKSSPHLVLPTGIFFLPPLPCIS